jgi:hypothetical protein
VRNISTIICVAFCLWSAMLSAQDVTPIVNRPLKGIPGSHGLQKEWARIGPILNEAVRRMGPEGVRNGLQKNEAWNFTVGSAKNWWATDLVAYTEYGVPSTCRAVGTNCYVFVEDALWNSRVIQQTVDTIRAAFDLRTPANGSKGIYQLDTEYFGMPPNVDADPKIIILVLDVKDGYSGGSSYTAGYFYSINQYSEAIVQQQLGSTRHSNQAEIYYLDANPANLMTASGFTQGASTTAHEFQHMIHFNYDQYEVSFVNEGMSESASRLCGYRDRSPAEYYQNTNVDFLGWNQTGDVLDDYSRAMVFSWYLVEQFGSNLTKRIVSSTQTSVTGYSAAFAAMGSSKTYDDVLKDFAVATMVNDTTVDSRYGFRSSVGGHPALHRTFTTTNVSLTQDTLRPNGTKYIQFFGGDSLQFTINSANALSVKAILSGSAGVRVENVTQGVPYLVPSYGVGYSKVTFAVTNMFQVFDAFFSYSSSGRGGAVASTIQYAGSPYAYLSMPSTNQKLAVRFTPTSSGRLYSTSVMFNAGANGVKGTGTLRVSVAQNMSGSIGGIPGTQLGTSIDIPFSKLLSGLYNEIDLIPTGATVSIGTEFHVIYEVIGGVGDTLQFLLDNGTLNPSNRTSAYRVGVNGLNWYNRPDPNYAAGRTPDNYNLLANVIIIAPTTPPSQPALLSPVTGSELQTTTAVLAWNASSEATSYHLQVSGNSGFSSFIINDSTVSGTSQQVTGLANLTTYYWRVRAKNSVGASAFSSTFSFSIMMVPPSQPSLGSPSDLATVQPTNLTLSWATLSTATAYRLQVSTDSLFSTPFIDDTSLTVTSRWVSGIINGMTYYWRVAARNAFGSSPYSVKRRFTVVNAAQVQVYPGDANNDGIVDVRDILPLGRFFGSTGGTRTSASGSWTPQGISSAWTLAEACYADCDGNGTVNAADVQVIVQNWARTRLGLSIPVPDPRRVCEELIGAIDALGSLSSSMLEIRRELVRYMTDALGIPDQFVLEQNWPNPFNPSTTIRFRIPEDVSSATLTIVNLLGQMIWEHEFVDVRAGAHAVTWTGGTSEGSVAATGVYLYKISAGKYQSVKRMTLLK